MTEYQDSLARPSQAKHFSAAALTIDAESFEATAYCKECNKEHDWESGYGEYVCGLKCSDSECDGSYDNPEHKGYHINAKHGASTFPACYFGAKCEKCETNPVAIVALSNFKSVKILATSIG